MTTAPVPSITDDLLAEIEEAAKAATPGPWCQSDRSPFQVRAGNASTGRQIAMMGPVNYHSSFVVDESNLRHVVAANPATIIALIAHIRQLERDAARYRFARAYENDCFMLNTLQVASMEDLDAAIDAAIDAARKQGG